MAKGRRRASRWRGGVRFVLKTEGKRVRGEGGGVYPLIQNDYRQEKIIFELFSGALQESPVRAPGAVTGGALTGQGPTQETIFGEFFSGALQENPVIAPGQLHEKMFIELFW